MVVIEGGSEMKQSIAEWARAAITIASLGAFGAGCSAEASILPAPPPSQAGTLTQRWSIDGSFDPNLCSLYGADRMELVVRDTSGRIVARAYQPCEQMEMSVVLPEGAYVGDAVLLAADNREVSTTLPLQPFRVLRGTDTFVDTDFPTSSMLRVLGAEETPASGEIDAEAD
jgi:hypothetical protein